MVTELVLAVLAAAVGSSFIGSAYALAKVGVASIAMLTEKPEQFFKGFLIATLCEALAIYGLVLGLLVLLGGI